eukprot:INCI15771.1.p1 GENE.INCI15771.1~~INCI15771.1.p1  ORF type:complete len:965 (+),score=220.00 INCI15771.1:119-3013(+)
MMQRWCAATAALCAFTTTGTVSAAPASTGMGGAPKTLSVADIHLDLFQLMDTDRSQTLSKDEFLAEWHVARLETEELERLWATEDKNGDGIVSWAEFGGPKGNVFAYLDSNNDNRLSWDEFTADWQVTLNRPLSDVKELFRREDANEDGAVSWAEFSGAKLSPLEPNFFQLLDLDNDGLLLEQEFAANWHSAFLRAAILANEPTASEDDVDIHAAFREMDSDSNHAVSIDEFAGFKLDPAEQLLERKRQAEMLLGVFQNLDTNADGRLSEAEFVVDGNKAPRGQTLQQRFVIEDLDGNGFIEEGEFGGPDQYIYRTWEPPEQLGSSPGDGDENFAFESPVELIERLESEIVDVQRAVQEHSKRGEVEDVEQATALLQKLTARLNEVKEQYDAGAFDGTFTGEDEDLRSEEELVELIDIVKEAIHEHSSRGEQEHVDEATALLQELEAELQDVRDASEAAVASAEAAQSSSSRSVSDDDAFSVLDLDKDGRVSRKEHSILLFQPSDLNHDGVLTRNEFRGPQGKDAGEPDVFADLDVDGSESITFEEYTAEWHTPPDVRFEEGDANKDGFLIAEEFARSSALGDVAAPATPDSRKTFQELDRNQDGIINWEEFSADSHVEKLAGAVGVQKTQAKDTLALVFADIDADSDGRISLQEHIEANAGPRREHVPEVDAAAASGLNMFDLLDLDGSGALTQEEYTAARLKHFLGRYWNGTVEEFGLADANGDDKIWKQEFPGRSNWSEPTMFDQLDSNDDDIISLREFASPDWHKVWIGKSGQTIYEAWETMDVDKDGVLHRVEFKGTFTPPRFKPATESSEGSSEGGSWEEQLAGDDFLNMFALLDFDGSNGVNASEFMAKWHAELFLEHNPNVDMEKFFGESDRDSNGILTQTEFPGPTRWAHPSIFDHLDSDKDGKVSLREFMINWHKIWIAKHGVTPNEVSHLSQWNYEADLQWVEAPIPHLMSCH